MIPVRAPWRRRLPWRSLLLLGLGVLLATAGRGWWIESRIRAARLAISEAARQQDWRRVEQNAAAWTQCAPDSGEAWLALADALQRQSRWEDAVAALGLVPSEDPHAVLALERRIPVEFDRLRRPDRGIAACRELIRLQPQHKLPYRRLALFYALTIQRPELLATIREAVEHRGDSPMIYALLMRLDNLGFRDGTDVHQRWGGHDPASRRFRSAALVQAVYVAANDALLDPGPRTAAISEAAVEAVYRELQSTPHDPVLLDFALLRASETADAEEMGRLLAEVPATCGNDPVFWRHRGVYYARLGMADLAERSFRQALQLHPMSALTRQELATLLRRQGRQSEAEKQQRVAAMGQDLVGVIERQNQIDAVSETTLRGIADYAAACEDWPIASAMHRRLLPQANGEIDR